MGHTSAARGADLQALGLGATVAIWSALYAVAFPPHGAVPSWLVAALVACCLLGAGYVLGRDAGRRAAGGAALGLVVSAFNLLVLLGLVGNEDPAARISAAWWIGGFAAAASVLGAAGAALGSRAFDPAATVNWTGRLALVTVATTLLMLVAGGIVTGLEAGLAVEGWLVAEGHALVLFPLSVMRRDAATFVEHAHRLWGLLLGLATILLAVHMWRVERRGWLRGLAAVALACVVVQGVLGGTRVTERSVALGIVHGVFAHLVLAVLVAIAAGTSTAWRTERPAAAASRAATGGVLGLVLPAAVLLQIVLGTAYRHLEPLASVSRGARMGLLHGHSFLGSALVVALALFCGLRAWGMHRDQPVLRKTGLALLHTTGLQVALGIVSFILVPKAAREAGEPIPILEVVFTTAHQVTGALLLSISTLLALWSRRLAGR